MSTPEESLNDQDPDYVSEISNDQVQQKIYEENARNSTARKITSIVEKEFSREIDLKEKEIVEIQVRLQKALKSLHFLRYVIITDFYNRKQCQIPQVAETNKQARIHPAVKSLLGKRPKSKYLTEPAVPSTSTDPRFLPTNESFTTDIRSATNSVSKTGEDAAGRNTESTAKNQELPQEECRPRKVPRYVPPKSSIPANPCPSRGERHKICKRIIVGNISKWIPPDWREDAASHKWTMYVRGDKDDADISVFVSKVRFFLHPSYRPNDVVEITSYPFHLSRRGWGEFPLRVQLHFKNPMNKPMDIIHHLKLDRTYTGLQTLGSETLVDLWIHTTDSRNSDQNISSESIESSVSNNEETKLNDSSNTEFTHEQSTRCVDTSKPSKLQYITNTTAEIRVKEETVSPQISMTSNPLADLIEESSNVKIKVESNDITPISNIHLSTDLHELYLEELRYYIDREHDYSCKKYSNSQRCTVREGNVTIEHFPENDCSVTTDSSALSINEEKSDNAAIKSYRCNGDIQSSSVFQSLTVSNINNAVENNSQEFSTTPEHTAFQKNSNPKNLLSFNENKSVRDSENSSNLSKNLKNSVKDTLTMINGFHKQSDATLDRLKKAASSSNTCDSHLKPLEISIPPLFASSTSKRIILMKDKKLIPVEVTKRLADGNAKISITSDAAKLNISNSVSILKKPPANNMKANTQLGSTISNKKEATILALKDTNKSLLLNVNYDIPALKIADSRDPRYNYSLYNTTRANVSSSGKRESSCARPEERDEKTVQRAKITLGKDKYGIQSKRELYETVLRSIESANITDIEALVRFIVRRLPIVTQDARDPEYRRLHPYACCSEKDFFACNVGKQRALEWCRAKTIKCFLRKKSIPDDQLWTVREIVIWARLHGYTPNRGAFGIPETNVTNNTKRLPDSSASTAILSTCTEPIAFKKWLQTCKQESSHQSRDDCQNTEIDVESIDENAYKSTTDRRENVDENNSLMSGSTLTPLELDESLMPLHDFVCDTARDIGIKIVPEEIIPGVVYCAASRVIMRVIECFVEDLTRSSLAKAWERNSGNECPKIITLDDVRNALVSREEFDIFTNEGLGSKQELETTID